MKLNLLLFGITRDVIGGPTLVVEMPPHTTAALLLDHLHERYPALHDLRALLLAVNSEYGQSDQILSEHDEIALIPPVSGG